MNAGFSRAYPWAVVRCVPLEAPHASTSALKTPWGHRLEAFKRRRPSRRTSEQLKSLRRSAQYASRMAFWFNNSRDALLSGQFSLAKFFSMKSAHYHEMRASFTRQFADVVFRSNNRGLPKNTVDLHSLTVPQAIERADAALIDALRTGQPRIVFVVGRGNAARPPKLLPAVSSHFAARGYHVGYNPRNKGVFMLRLGHESFVGDRHVQDKYMASRRAYLPLNSFLAV